ncbi:MAG TPA: nucleotide exchange factor GrpE [Oligoflexia bacterium]|nr:nucleotide exchange factor GrpE [Oligoflexia bacterium]
MNTENPESTKPAASASEELENATDSAASGEYKLAELEAQLADQKSKYLYLYAEFETYKKRAIKERSELLKFGHENFAGELLLTADNLERAIQNSTEAPKNLLDGLKMVQQQLQDTFSRFGVTEIQSIEAKFNPELHEAVGQELSENKESGSILAVVQKGYLLHGRLLRAARVIIAK